VERTANIIWVIHCIIREGSRKPPFSWTEDKTRKHITGEKTGPSPGRFHIRAGDEQTKYNRQLGRARQDWTWMSHRPKPPLRLEVVQLDFREARNTGIYGNRTRLIVVIILK